MPCHSSLGRRPAPAPTPVPPCGKQSHPCAGAAHCAVARALVAQNRPEDAFVAGQRGAEVLAAALGRVHPATLDALQLCADILEGAQVRF